MLNKFLLNFWRSNISLYTLRQFSLLLYICNLQYCLKKYVRKLFLFNFIIVQPVDCMKNFWLPIRDVNVTRASFSNSGGFFTLITIFSLHWAITLYKCYISLLHKVERSGMAEEATGSNQWRQHVLVTEVNPVYRWRHLSVPFVTSIFGRDRLVFYMIPTGHPTYTSTVFVCDDEDESFGFLKKEFRRRFHWVVVVNTIQHKLMRQLKAQGNRGSTVTTPEYMNLYRSMHISRDRCFALMNSILSYM